MLLLVNATKILRSLKLLFIVVNFALMMLILSSPVFACDCAGPTGKKAIRKNSVAFRGTVTNIEYLNEKTGKIEPRIKVTFSVSRFWSGNVGKTFVLHTTENSWSCAGYYFVTDKEYLVVAYPNGEVTEKKFDSAKNTFGTNPCGATLPIKLAERELEELGEGKEPEN